MAHHGWCLPKPDPTNQPRGDDFRQLGTSSKVNHQRFTTFTIHQDILNGIHDHHIVPSKGFVIGKHAGEKKPLGMGEKLVINPRYTFYSGYLFGFFPILKNFCGNFPASVVGFRECFFPQMYDMKNHDNFGLVQVPGSLFHGL